MTQMSSYIWNGNSCSWVRRINIVKMNMLPKAIHRFNAIPIKTPMIFPQKWNKKFKKCVWKQEKFWIAKAILRKKNSAGGKADYSRCWPWHQTTLQSYRHQNRMVLAQKQKYRSVGKDRKSRNKIMHLQSINLWQRRQGYKMGKRQSLQSSVLGNLDSYV